MKKVNGMTVYEENDICALDEYSEQIEKDITQKIKEKETDIANIQKEQITQKNKITSLETDNTSNKTNITQIKEKNTEQDTKLSKLEIENTELKSENERLREDLKGLPKGAFSGEVIDLNDSADMRLQSLEIGGNSRQKEITDNLIDNFWQQGGISDITGIEQGDTNIRSDFIKIYPNYLYSISRSIFNSYMAYRFYDKDKIYLGNQLSEGMLTSDKSDGRMNFNEDSMTFTILNNNVRYMRIIDASNNLNTKYTLTTEARKPNYPSEIECCGDNINLFINEDMENAYINSDGDYIGNGNNALYPFMKVNTKTIYCASANVQMANMVFVEYDKNKNFIKRNVLGNIQNGTYQLSENCNYIRFNCNYKNGVNITKDFIDTLEIKIEEGSTPTLYSKFGQGNISFEMCNKNLAKTSKVGQHGTPIIKFSEKYTGPLTIAMKPISGNTQLNYRFFYADGTAGGDNSVTLVNTENNKWYCISLNVKNVIGVGTYNVVHQGYTSRTLEKQFIAKGQYSIQSDKDYIEHQSQTYTIPTQKPFRKIDSYKDIFIKKIGKWYERHYIERKIFDGTEGLYDFRTWGDCYRIFITITGAKIYSSNFGNGQLCSHFKYDNNGTFGINENTKDGVFAQYKDTSQFYFVTDKTSAEDFKTFLQEKYNSGTPVYIDYVLEEPEDIECTLEQTEILDKIENEAKTYKNITHIYSTDEISPILEGTYNKDIETMINNIATTVAESEE